MNNKSLIVDARGFTLMEALIAMAVVLAFGIVTLEFISNQERLRARTQIVATEDRIVAGVRSLAGNPSALRNSMRAITANSGATVNPELLACAGGNPINSCQNLQNTPFTLYGPLVTTDPLTEAITVQPTASPANSSNPLRFDAWGTPCAAGNTTCPLIVYMSFAAQCPPAEQTQAALNNAQANGTLSGLLQPLAVCTVAEAINVIFTVQLDQTLAGANPDLKAFAQPVTGNVVTPVLAISGNMAQ